jgi:surfeit locus 1 family protein
VPTAVDHAASEEALNRTARSRLVLSGIMVALAVVFVGLGAWQVQRLFWKLDLIARVEARIHRTAVPAPSASEWADVSTEKDEYRQVTARGTFDHAKAALVQAVTARGAGFWVVTPLQRDDGSTILINRGFVPADRRDPTSRASGNPSGPVAVTGLLRITEPGGGFLRSNDPAGGRWYSRDVAAIAEAKGLANVAPYFIDADATPNPGGLPVGGLTVVSFRNSHLVYALTWFALAAMSAAAGYLIYRRRLA